jgi:hypothetical protein
MDLSLENFEQKLVDASEVNIANNIIDERNTDLHVLSEALIDLRSVSDTKQLHLPKV